ncbi:winged helix-turn-helix transcriptional regulator [Caulobacter rhizosphaerae]|jgi:DNA-binding HxlR family transcriptional regulator|uniref:winged helix-turn-helix transcriptional regulator n=1 Tax=Caulobacter rhizosphaerae TaxID=2010972 RepID=UPI0013D1627C|nr:helix-turn-helix domain-containing protein [Caulobacter rhizosphaerae]GGL46586.1 HxlR family transcriptional regulator [Caulobacter rhizosphaerae]
MGRTADYTNERCAIAATLEVVGDPWTLLILRDAFQGVKRFEQWQERLGVARNVLAARLKSLVANGVLEPRRYSERPPRQEYVLTPKGRALSPVLLTMAEWGDQHVYGLGKGPVHFVHKTCGWDFHPKLACEACGQIVDGRDLGRVVHEEQALTVGQALEASAKIAAE